MCPKYPNEAARNSLFLKIFENVDRLSVLAAILFGPSGTKKKIKSPPNNAIIEVAIIIGFQDEISIKPFNICGNAVPRTKAPTRKLNDLPRPFL